MSDPTLDEFRDEITAFLDANAERREEVQKEDFVWGEGSDEVALFEEVDREQELKDIEVAKAWRAKRYDAGLGWITGPKEYGGRELTQAHERLWGSLEAKYKTPAQGSFGIGLVMVAPTTKDHATREVKTDILPNMHRAGIV